MACSSFIEDVRVQDRNRIETWTSAVVCKDSKQVFGYQLNAGNRTNFERGVEISNAGLDDILSMVRSINSV